MKSPDKGRRKGSVLAPYLIKLSIEKLHVFGDG